jgi:hypothetical protein
VVLTRGRKPVAAVVPVEDVAALEALEHEHDAAELRARVAEWEAEGRATIRIGEIAVRYGLEISKSGWPWTLVFTPAAEKEATDLRGAVRAGTGPI